MSDENTIAIIDRASEIVIMNAEELTMAVSILSELNRALDEIAEHREKLTKPLNEALREVRERYKGPEEALKSRVNEIRRKMSEYQGRMLEEAQEAKEKLVERVKEGEIKPGTAVKRFEKLIVDKSVDSEDGDSGVTFVPIKKFEVVDVRKVPIEFLMANEVKLRAAMKMGREVPGVRYWVEQSVRNTR